MTLDQTVVLVPALEMTRLVGRFRMSYDPSARAGVPAHITLLYPFVDPSQLTDQLLTQLDELLEPSDAFTYSVTEVREFEQGVLYLAPEPANRFMRLTTMISDHFHLLPFGGAHPTVVPHLTVIQSAPELERSRIGSILKSGLPLTARASEAWLMVGNNESRWKTVHVSRFR